MKREFLSGIFALVLFATTGFGVSKSMKGDVTLNDLALTNVEVLAQSENDMCPNGCDSNGDGCYCNGWYLKFAEHIW